MFDAVNLLTPIPSRPRKVSAKTPTSPGGPRDPELRHPCPRHPRRHGRAPVSCLAHIEPGLKAQLTASRLQDVLVAIAPIVGTARVMSAGGKIAEALGIAIEVTEAKGRDGGIGHLRSADAPALADRGVERDPASEHGRTQSDCIASGSPACSEL